MARKAALTYLAARRDGDFVGIFSIDLALHTVQNFTADTDRIRTAIDLAATQAGTSFASRPDRRPSLQTPRAARPGRRERRDVRLARAAAPAARAATPGGAMAMAGGAAVERDIARLQVGMMRSFEALERDQQGFATSNGLLAVVQRPAARAGPQDGRVLLRGHGDPGPGALAVPGGDRRRRTAPTWPIYTMDAGGPAHAQPDRADPRRARGRGRRRATATSARRTQRGIMMKDAERNEDLLRLNPQSGLGQLAEQTGGFLVRDTNDARGSFRQIAQDMRFHYVLGYTPSNDNYDGRFRNGEREGAAAAGRTSTRGAATSRCAPAPRTRCSPTRRRPSPCSTSAGPRPETFPLRRRWPSRSRQAGADVDGPGAACASRAAASSTRPAAGQKDVMAADLAVVVRVRNEYQQEVSRMSQHYQLSSPAAKLEAARAGDILFYRQAELPPGQYMRRRGRLRRGRHRGERQELPARGARRPGRGGVRSAASW